MSSAQWCNIGTFFRQGKIKTRWCSCWQRLCSWISCFMQTHKKAKLLKFLIFDVTYNDSSTIDWSRKAHAHAAIRVKIWWIINTYALPSKGHLPWCPAPNYDNRLYTLIHHMQQKDFTAITYSEITHLILCVWHLAIKFLYCTILWSYHIAKCSKY